MKKYKIYYTFDKNIKIYKRIFKSSREAKSYLRFHITDKDKSLTISRYIIKKFIFSTLSQNEIISYKKRIFKKETRIVSEWNKKVKFNYKKKKYIFPSFFLDYVFVSVDARNTDYFESFTTFLGEENRKRNLIDNEELIISNYLVRIQSYIDIDFVNNYIVIFAVKTKIYNKFLKNSLNKYNE